MIYFTIASLDSCIEDDAGTFAWARPGDEVHVFVNDLIRPVRTYLYGRRMYETIVVWETDSRIASGAGAEADCAKIWQAASNVLYSTTLAAPSTRTRIERNFDAPAVRDVKATGEADMMIGGAELAGAALRADLVDECPIVLVPVIVGAGKPALPHRVASTWSCSLSVVRRRRHLLALPPVRTMIPSCARPSAPGA